MRFSEALPMRWRWPASSVLLGCVLFALACGRGGNAFTTNGSDPQLGDSVAVRVVNDNYYSARVRAIYEGGGRFIIGTVESHNGGDDFMIPLCDSAVRQHHAGDHSLHSRRDHNHV